MKEKSKSEIVNEIMDILYGIREEINPYRNTHECFELVDAAKEKYGLLLTLEDNIAGYSIETGEDIYSTLAVFKREEKEISACDDPNRNTAIITALYKALAVLK